MKKPKPTVSETEITEGEWLALMEKLRPQRPPGAKTRRELQELWGMSQHGVADRINRLTKAGLLDVIRVNHNTVYYLPKSKG